MRHRLRASALLSLLTAAATLSSNAFEGNPPFVRRSSSSNRPNQQDALQVALSAPPVARRRNKKTTTRPPLIDSDLLRFLSAQKQLTRNATTSSTTTTAKPKNNSFMTAATTTQLETTATVMEDESGVSTIYYHDNWLRQYNAHAVSSLLAHNGVQDEALASRAGDAVQATALARVARRRIRAFLKERDRQWGVSSRQQLLPVTNDTWTSSSSMQEMVDLLVQVGGLTSKDVAEILVHTPSIALMRVHSGGIANSNGECLEETFGRAMNLLCHVLQLRKYDARKILRTCPGLLTMRGSRNAEQVVTVLSQLGVSYNSIARDKNALPTLLSRSPSDVFRLVAFLSSDAIRMPIANVGPLLRRKECQGLLDKVAPVSRSSCEGDDIDSKAEDFVTSVLWGRASQLRSDNINEAYRNMSTTAWTLRHEIGTADLGRVISAYPSVLLLDAKKQILPAASYLMDELGIWHDDLASVLQLYPVLLGLDLAQMKRVASYLLSLEVAEENLASIFRSFPALLTLDIEKDMMPVVDFLGSIGIANVGRFISRLPPVLGYSVENELMPKFQYLESVVVNPRFELSRFPAYFSYPLERVIKARFQYLHEVKRIPTPLVSLDQVLRYGDKDFAVKVARDKDGGAEFRAFCQERVNSSAIKQREQSKRPQKAKKALKTST